MIQKERKEALYVSVVTFVVFFLMVACLKTRSVGTILVLCLCYFLLSWKVTAEKRTVMLDIWLFALVVIIVDLFRIKGLEISGYDMFSIQISLFVPILLFEMVRWHMRLMSKGVEGTMQNKAIV